MSFVSHQLKQLSCLIHESCLFLPKTQSLSLNNAEETRQERLDAKPKWADIFFSEKNSKYLMMTEAFLVSLSYMISQEVCRCHSFLTHSSGLFFWVISTSQLFDVLIVSWHTLQLISVNHYLLPNCLKSIFIRVISDIKADNLWWWKHINL